MLPAAPAADSRTQSRAGCAFDGGAITLLDRQWPPIGEAACSGGNGMGFGERSAGHAALSRSASAVVVARRFAAQASRSERR